MHQVFSVETKDGDKTKSETAILYWARHANPYHALHKLGVEYALSPAGVKVRCTGLTFAELLNRLTPEALAPYGLEIIWPEREAVTLGAGRQIVSTYEIQSHLEARERERQRNANRERRTRETAERYARRLERLKADGHPVLSGWDAGRVCNRAVSWACQYVRAGARTLTDFLNESWLMQSLVRPAPPRTRAGPNKRTLPNPRKSRGGHGDTTMAAPVSFHTVPAPADEAGVFASVGCLTGWSVLESKFQI